MIQRLRREVEQGDLTLGEIFEILRGGGSYLVILFLCLPFLQPIPLPGLSTPLGLLIIFGALTHALGRQPWIPASWKKKDFASPALRKTLQVADAWVSKLERWIHPRWVVLVRPALMRWVNASVVIIAAFLLCLPLPVPFSNTVPALTIVLQAFGQLEEDGVLIVVSYLMFAACLSFFGGLALGVESGIGLFVR
ncbi:MAG: exopolysaccharide biosynthesis protein [Bdellovibrionaceae bacterium]|nr:exopolysaccharide biosynthesis protein [Pseudobdellovibrionaceae bacterium]